MKNMIYHSSTSFIFILTASILISSVFHLSLLHSSNLLAEGNTAEVQIAEVQIAEVQKTEKIIAAKTSKEASKSEPENLAAAITAKKAVSDNTIPTEAKTIMRSALKKLQVNLSIEHIVPIGSVFPDAPMLDVHGKQTSLYKELNGSPAIITFYRGGWCPYCNLQLHYYQKILPEIRRKGATLIAISPETPDNTLTTAEKNKIEFTVLSDKNNTLANQLQIVFSLGSDLKKIYQNFGIDLSQSQGNTEWQLPLAASFVIDSSHKVLYRFVDHDYTKRAPESELLNALSHSD